MLRQFLKLVLPAVAAALVSAAPACAQSAVTAPPAQGASGPARSVVLNYAQLPPGDSIFQNIWPDEKSLNATPAQGLPPRAYVTYVRDPSGSLLTISMLYAQEECGPSLCPIKILRDGKLIKEFVGCDEPAGHRIALDGSYLAVCDARVALR